MPPRLNLIEDLLGILNYRPRAAPAARTPMTAARPAAPTLDIDEMAQRLGERARASTTGERAVREALRPPGQSSPEMPLPPAVRMPASDVAAAARQQAPALVTEFEQLLGRMPAEGRSKVRAAPIPTNAAPGVEPTAVTAAPRVDPHAVAGTREPRTPEEQAEYWRGVRARQQRLAGQNSPSLPPPPIPRQALAEINGARRFLRDHFGYEPAGEPVAWARRYGLTSPETYRPGTAQRHPTLYRTPEQLALHGQMPASELAVARSMADPLAANSVMAQRGRQPLTPSRAPEPQTQRVAPAPPRNDYTQPAVQQFMQRYVPHYTPEQFNDHYFAGLVARPEVRQSASELRLNGTLRAPRDLTLHRRDGTAVTIPAGTNMGSITRTFDPGRRTAYNALFSMDNRWQGLGIAKRILKNQVEVYRRIGVNKVAVSAGLSGGGHTWARFGFVPDSTSWRGVQNSIRRRLEAVQDLDPAYRAAVERLIDRPDPVTIRDIAKLSMRPGVNTDSRLGQQLLRGSHWSGVLDLTDAATLRHFEDYVSDAPSW